MKLLPYLGRSGCWWGQKSSTLFVFIFLCVFMLRFVWLANLEISHISLQVYPESELTTVSLGESNTVADAAYVELPGITLNTGQTADFSVDFCIKERTDAPAGLLRRCRWLLLRESGSLWLDASDSLDRLSGAYTAFKSNSEGLFILMACAPPLDASELVGQNAASISRFLQGLNRARVTSLYITVTSANNNKEKNGGSISGRQATRPDALEVPPPPQEPNNAADLHSGTGAQTAEPESPKLDDPTDLRTSHAGTSNSVDRVESISANTSTNSSDHSMAQDRIAQVPPRSNSRKQTPLEIEKLRMQGNLPEVRLQVRSPGFGALGAEDWWELVRKYNMPLVFVLKPDFMGFYDGLPVLMPGGVLEEVSAEEIGRRYGRFPIALESLSEEIQAIAKEQAGAGLWVKSRRILFFLGDATLLPFEEALSRGNDLQDIKSLTAVLGITKTDGVHFVVEELFVNLKERIAE